MTVNHAPVWATPLDVLALALTQDYYLANVLYTVSIDDKIVGGTRTMVSRSSDAQPDIVSIMGDFGVGPHKLTINFLNDASGADGDRNLIVRSIAYDGVDYSNVPFNALQPGLILTHFNALPVTQYYQGPSNFTFGDTTSVPCIGTYNVGSAISPFNFSAPDPDNDVVTYSLSAGTIPTGLALSPHGVVTGTPSTSLIYPLYLFSVSAKDGKGGVATKEFSVAITNLAVQTIWVTPAGSLGTFPANRPLSFPLVAHDPAGKAVHYYIVYGGLPPGTTLNATTGVITGSPYSTAGVYSTSQFMNFFFTVGALLSNNSVITRNFSITIPANRAPVWNTPGNLGTFVSGTLIPPIALNASDADGDFLTFAFANIPRFLGIEGGNRVTGSLIPVSATTTYNFNGSVSDGHGGLVTKQFSLTATIAPKKTTWQTKSLPPATIGSPYSTQLNATTATSQLIFALAPGYALPAGLTLSPSGLVYGVLTSMALIAPYTVPPTYIFVATINDGSQTVAATLGLPLVALPLQFVAPKPYAVLGTFLPNTSITLTGFVAVPGNGGPVTYTTGVNAFMTISNVTNGTATVVGSYSTGGLQSFLITASDGYGKSALASWALVIYSRPVWATTVIPQVSHAVLFSITLKATVTNGQANYTVASGTLPAGAALSAATGILSGTVAAPGLSTFTVACTDATGLSTISNKFILHVV